MFLYFMLLFIWLHYAACVCLKVWTQLNHTLKALMPLCVWTPVMQHLLMSSTQMVFLSTPNLVKESHIYIFRSVPFLNSLCFNSGVISIRFGDDGVCGSHWLLSKRRRTDARLLCQQWTSNWSRLHLGGWYLLTRAHRLIGVEQELVLWELLIPCWVENSFMNLTQQQQKVSDNVKVHAQYSRWNSGKNSWVPV